MRRPGSAASPGQGRAGPHRARPRPPAKARGSDGAVREGRRSASPPGEPGSGRPPGRRAWTSAPSGATQFTPTAAAPSLQSASRKSTPGSPVEGGHPAGSRGRGRRSRRRGARSCRPAAIAARASSRSSWVSIQSRSAPAAASAPAGELVSLARTRPSDGPRPPDRARPVAPTQPATAAGRARRASATARRATSPASRSLSAASSRARLKVQERRTSAPAAAWAGVHGRDLPGPLEDPALRESSRRQARGRGAPFPWPRRAGRPGRRATRGSSELRRLEVAGHVDLPARARRCAPPARPAPPARRGRRRSGGEAGTRRRASAPPRRGPRGPRSPGRETTRARTGMSLPCMRMVAAPFCRRQPRVPAAWNPTRRMVVRGLGQAALQVVEDASAGGHARRGDDDARTVNLVDGLRLLGGAGEGEPPGAQGLDAPVEQGVHLGVVVLPVGPVDGRRVRGHRGVDEDRQRRDAPGLLELPQEEEDLLGPADGEGGHDDGAPRAPRAARTSRSSSAAAVSGGCARSP